MKAHPRERASRSAESLGSDCVWPPLHVWSQTSSGADGFSEGNHIARCVAPSRRLGMPTSCNAALDPSGDATAAADKIGISAHAKSVGRILGRLTAAGR